MRLAQVGMSCPPPPPRGFHNRADHTGWWSYQGLAEGRIVCNKPFGWSAPQALEGYVIQLMGSGKAVWESQHMR